MSKPLRTYSLTGSVNWKRFGARVRRGIEKTGLSYRDLAHELDGPTHPTLYRIANGRPCSVEMYLWVCREFAIDPAWAYRHNSVALATGDAPAAGRRPTDPHSPDSQRGGK